jgi:hypothetical protein
VHLQERVVVRRRIAQRPTVLRGERAPDADNGGSAPQPWCGQAETARSGGSRFAALTTATLGLFPRSFWGVS